MARKLNACTKKKLIFVLIVIFIFILSIAIINTVVQRVKSNVATEEEMKACSSTLESIYKKLDSEEIKLLSEDGSETLTCSIPNKEFGRVIVSRDSDGNLMFRYDYQKSEMNGKLFEEAFIGSIIMILFGVLCIFGLLFPINGLIKKKISKKETQSKAQAESQSETK